MVIMMRSWFMNGIMSNTKALRLSGIDTLCIFSMINIKRYWCRYHWKCELRINAFTIDKRGNIHIMLPYIMLKMGLAPISSLKDALLWATSAYIGVHNHMISVWMWYIWSYSHRYHMVSCLVISYDIIIISVDMKW